ncbi:MAG: DUF362 domain-containing protein [Oscillospiraceae bacterium]|jgi:hypothetical protein|nr:DUF362 domain-containing protein [Oscillospiraceae bacterium]
MTPVKRLLAALAAVVILLSFAACDNGKASPVSSEPSEPPSSQTVSSALPESESAPPDAGSDAPEESEGPDDHVVYMTTEITPQGLEKAFQALGRVPSGKVAVKVHFGEPGGNFYLDPQLIGGLVQSLGGTLVETNTVSGGSPRANTALHLQIAADHGFTDIAPVEILDAGGEMALPVEGGKHLTENLVGAGLADYDFCVVLSHFKGQSTGGFSGVIRNASIGLASVPGKCRIHTAGADDTTWRGGDPMAFLESTAEAAKSVSDYFENGENIVYLHVLNHLSLDCDCRSHPREPDMHDIGILASTDPVALEQASVDLVFAAPDGETLSRRIEEGGGLRSLEYGEEIGLGSRSYQMISLDKTGADTKAHPYLRELAASIAKELVSPEMNEYERAKAAFDYIITHVSMGEPIGPELWRIHGGGDAPIPFVEQRALSPLRFGVGMCEDYAAALTLLLREMGLSAEYVLGLTFSAEGHLVDHAWTMVQIDGVWYHLDSQLEDNISRRGSVRYKYFLRGDATLSGSHRWGQNLMDSRLLTGEQNREIEENFLFPAAPEDYPTPERLTIAETPAPDLEALRKEAEAEIAAWEAENGPLPEMNLNTVPPVFGLEGYGPAEEG